jgi:hypothetical protein
MRLQKVGSLNLLDILDFGRIHEINACIKMLLSYVDGGYMWLDKTISINIDLIMRIIGILPQGEDPSLLFFNKKNEKYLANSMKDKFHKFHKQHSLYVARISDPTVRFLMQALSCKLLRMCRNDQVLEVVIATTTRCVEGI